MNTDNMFGVLPGQEDSDLEEDASPHETPPQPTRQGLTGEGSPNVRALAAEQVHSRDPSADVDTEVPLGESVGPA